MKRRILSLLLSLNAWGATYDIETLKADMTFFADASCSQLRTGVQLKDLNGFKSELLK